MATIHALPSLPGMSRSKMDPDPDSEFSLAMNVNGTYASLNAVYFKDLGVRLEAKDPDSYPGTPGVSC